MAYWLWQSPGRRGPELWPLLQGLLMEFVQITGHMDMSISECRVSLLPPAEESALSQGVSALSQGLSNYPRG